MIVGLTGAGGYLGRHITLELLRRNHEVVALTRTPVAGIEHRPFDLSQDITPDLSRLDGLVHAAWDFQPRGFDAAFAVNAGGAARLLGAARDLRLIDISTMSAFDGCRSVYGRVKKLVEAQFLEAGGIVLRPGLVWSDHPGGMMGTLDRLVHLPVTPVIAGGGMLRLVHVDDLSVLVAVTLESENFSPQIFTVADPRPFTLNEILQKRAHRLHRCPLQIPIPWPLVWLGIRLLESITPRAALRSDSVTGLAYSDPAPRFDLLPVPLRPFV